MARWYQAPTTEQELLDRLYGLTNGYFVAADEYSVSSPPIPWGGYEEARNRAADPTYLKMYKRELAWRIGKFGLLPLPGAQLVTSPLRLKFCFGAMAGAAWANGYTKGVGPKDKRDAQYDLLAITTVWAQSQQGLGWTDVAGLPSQGSGDIQEIGKRFLYVLAQNGALKLGRTTYGDVLGPLAAVALSQEILPALGGELFRAFRHELFDSAVDEFIPGIASVTSVSRARRRFDAFYDLAQRYYNYKRDHG